MSWWLLIGLSGDCRPASNGTALLYIEGKDGPRFAFVEYLEVFFLQISDRAALFVSDHDGHQDPVDTQFDQRSTGLCFGL
jgi:hypothetical protein